MKEVTYYQVQAALSQVDSIKSNLYRRGIYNFTENEEYQKAVERYEDLYDLYEENKKKYEQLN